MKVIRDIGADLQAIVDDTRKQLEEHRRSDHTPEYERQLRELPQPPWTSEAPRRLQFSPCPICNALIGLIADILNSAPTKITLIMPGGLVQ